MLNPQVPTERERRWLVKEWLPTIKIGAKSKKIVQGYFEVLGERSFRVRIIDDEHAVVTLKEGSGEVRSERELPIDIHAARVMLEATPFRVEKRRYMINNWELDIFEGPLSGIVVLEYEAKGDESIPSLPSWIEKAIDVTDSLTNLHLARMAKELSGDAEVRIARFLEPKLPKIVLTGGPCSGKSTLMREIEERYGDYVHCVPEVATILISQVGIHPDANDEEHNARFQKILYRVQRSFEEAAELQALKDGKKAIVLDRGTIDAIAYLPDEETFARLIGVHTQTERDRYFGVLILQPPTQDVYEQFAHNNPARFESYEQAVHLSQKTQDAWFGHGHPAYFLIDGFTWEEKRKEAFDYFEKLLALAERF